MDEKVGKGKWVSDWFGGDDVLKQIYQIISNADYYRRFLYREPWIVLHPYFIELRILFSKIGPLMVSTKAEEYQKKIKDMKGRVDIQVGKYNRQNSAFSCSPKVDLDADLAADLEELHDDLLRFMQKSKLWIPSSYSKAASTKKKAYFGVSNANPEQHRQSQ